MNLRQFLLSLELKRVFHIWKLLRQLIKCSWKEEIAWLSLNNLSPNYCFLRLFTGLSLLSLNEVWMGLIIEHFVEYCSHYEMRFEIFFSFARRDLVSFLNLQRSLQHFWFNFMLGFLLNFIWKWFESVAVVDFLLSPFLYYFLCVMELSFLLPSQCH